MRISILLLSTVLIAAPAKSADVTTVEGTGGWSVQIIGDPAPDGLGQCGVTRYASAQSRDFSGQGTATSLIWFDLTRGEVGFVAYQAPLRPGETVLQVGESLYPTSLGPHRVKGLISQVDAPAILEHMFNQNAVAKFGDDWIAFDTRGFLDTFKIAWDQCPEDLIRIEAPESVAGR
ncbi:MAG: hypothetical protein AAF415_17965 [Pseudomonadota bacterium]